VKANHFDTLPFNKDFPTMMEFEIDITCNLECTMCSGDYSNLIRKNKEHRPPLVMKYDMEFVEQLTPYFKHLHEARFSGGEPFLIDLYYEMWNRIAEYNPHCLISIQSNGTILNNRVKNTLTKGKFEIGISLDSLQKEVFESIRINAKFDTVISNIEYFGAYCKEKKRHLDCQFV
jgi:sulfatase maturation enzyme AslB (radical SAM superfamily)